MPSPPPPRSVDVGAASYPRRLLAYACSLALLATGVSLMIRARIGVAPFDSLVTGVAERADLSVGVAGMIVPAAFVVLGMVFGARPGLGTAMAVLLVGPVINLVLPRVPEPELLALRIPLYVVALALITAAVTGFVVTHVGTAPVELFMLALHERYGFAVPGVRAGIEGACVAGGFLLGGQVGVGTLLVAVALGPLLRVTLPRVGFDPSAHLPGRDTAAPEGGRAGRAGEGGD